MRVVIHGVRGSTPAAALEFTRVGGNTSCVAISRADSDEPTLLLDAGTGVRTVTSALAGRPFRGQILLSHLHWDHVQGIPFFRAADRDDATVRVRLPAQDDASSGTPGSAEALLAEAMSPPHFPIGPDGLRGDWTFEALETGRIVCGGFAVTARDIPHKGGRTFGYRIEADDVRVAYLPDHDAEFDSPEALELCDGVDVLLHGGMFGEDERDTARAFGHGTIGDACRLARDADVGSLVIVHHAPNRTDDEVEELIGRYAEHRPRPIVGHEGDVVLDSAV